MRYNTLIMTLFGVVLASCSSGTSDIDAFKLPKNEAQRDALTTFAHRTVPVDNWQNFCSAPREEIEAKITLIGDAQGWDQATLDTIRKQEAKRIKDLQLKYAPKPTVTASELTTDIAIGKAIRNLEAYDQFWASAIVRYPELATEIPEKNRLVFGLIFNEAQCKESDYALAALKSILDVSDFPNDERFGKGTSRSLFLLTQHADEDVKLQKKILTKFRANPDSLPATAIALLTDRVKINQGQPQIYGSQLECTDNGYKPKPVENPDELDARRASVGLEPIADYVATNPGCGNSF
ncbi:hypothetical protein N9W89_07120 [Hellea sp.]|nr:hypothetical protein [Hellea sp.]